MKTITRYTLAAALAVVVLSTVCRPKSGAGAGGEGPKAPAASGPTSVTLTPEAVAAADLKTAAAAIRTVDRRIPAAGEIEWNSRRVVHLTARTPGRLERVLVVQGDRVREGQLLAEIYSPDYLTLQAEYIQAAARAKRHAGNPSEEGPARAVLAGARERLSLLGVIAGEIEAIDASGLPRPLLHVHAPLGGTVLQCDVVAGDAVDLGTSLFRLADPSTLWAGLHIQEKDLGALTPGDEVLLRTQAYPGEEFRGRLALIGDVVDAATRTVAGRVEMANPGGRLKSGMYVEASIRPGGERRALTVPEEAVQDDEGRSIVFVKTGERTYTRRPVQLGERFDGVVEVLKGVADGEIVVTSGSFLLKSELRKGTMVED
jgi:multidrug efflux pump subunit AcrA (membrane-fusion protein)